MGWFWGIAAFFAIAYVIADKEELARLRARQRERYKWWHWALCITVVVVVWTWLIYS